MGPVFKRHFTEEIPWAAEARARGDHPAEKCSLERAHVLSQPFAGAHLGAAWRWRDVREVLGQLPRLLLAELGSWTGRAPRGITGGADVGILQTMVIPEDLARVLVPQPRLLGASSRGSSVGHQTLHWLSVVNGSGRCVGAVVVLAGQEPGAPN